MRVGRAVTIKNRCFGPPSVNFHISKKQFWSFFTPHLFAHLFVPAINLVEDAPTYEFHLHQPLIYNLSPLYLPSTAGVERERPPTYEKLPDPCHRWGVYCRGRGQQQEVIQEACRPVHPAGPEKTALHPSCGETQDALQETHQDHPQGAGA